MNIKNNTHCYNYCTLFFSHFYVGSTFLISRLQAARYCVSSDNPFSVKSCLTLYIHYFRWSFLLFP